MAKPSSAGRLVKKLTSLATRDERLVVGLMSGTSADGIDAALVKCHGWGHWLEAELVDFVCVRYEPTLAERLGHAAHAGVAELARLNFDVGEAFAAAALAPLDYEHYVERQLEPVADGFRSYLQKGAPLAAEHMLVDKAFMLNLSAPEMTALVGAMRALNANAGQSQHGVLTDRPETLTNDFFANVLDIGTEWKPVSEAEDVFEGRDRDTGEVRWTGTRVDLIFGSNSELRALAEIYGSSDGEEKLVRDFVAAWDKVMSNDRFDLA